MASGSRSLEQSRMRALLTEPCAATSARRAPGDKEQVTHCDALPSRAACQVPPHAPPPPASQHGRGHVQHQAFLLLQAAVPAQSIAL